MQSMCAYPASQKKSQVVDELIIVDEEHLLGTDHPPARLITQGVAVTAIENILMAVTQFGNNEVGIHLSLAIAHLDFHVADQSTHARTRLLRMRRFTFQTI